MDCIYFREGLCTALDVGYCIGSLCDFVKSAEQAQLDKLELAKRLYSLPFDLQVYIGDKYYGGKLWWRNGTSV